MKIIKNMGKKPNKKIYSKIDQIPKGRATKKITSGCLVVEGGGFRGLYNQGVLDALMVNGINFDTTIGVSAGALAGINYICGQIGRPARINLKFRHDSEYIGLKAIKKSKSPLNLNFLLYRNKKVEPLDFDTFKNSKQRFIAVATNCVTGDTEYFEKGKCKDIFAAVKASASMPFLSKMVDVDGKLCLDGGCSCKIAYQWALDQGFEKIVIVKTRQRGFRKEVKDRRKNINRFYKKYPKFVDKFADSEKNYNLQCDKIDELEKSGRAFVIAPSQIVKVGRLESNVEKLVELYWLGYNDMESQIENLKQYLETDLG